MALEPEQLTLTYYPAYCYKASPTYFAWVKVTAHNIHHILHSNQRFRNPNKSLLLFFLNHPIQFVQVVGIVVAYEDFYEKFWSFTVDDGSGEVIETTCPKPSKEAVKCLQEGQVHQKKDATTQEEEARVEVVKKIDVGSVVQVKGTISTFREIRQIQLERISIVPNTTAEMRLVAARTKALEDVLSKPWVLSSKKQNRLLKEAQGEIELEKNKTSAQKTRQAKREAREKRHAEEVLKEYEKDEKQRLAAAQDAREAAMQLKTYPDLVHE